MRKFLKILHTLSAAGLIGGLACHMILLALAPQDTVAAYADLRASIKAINDYVVLPSLAVALVSGVVSMAVHTPFLSQSWALVKAVLGILMFKGVLTVVVAKTSYVAEIAERIEQGESLQDSLALAIAYEWYALWAVMALSAINVILGIWRPRQITLWPARTRHSEPKRGKLKAARERVRLEAGE